MRSRNFEFLRPFWADLAELGAHAELYAHFDPASSLVKLRNFCELVTKSFYVEEEQEIPSNSDLFGLMTNIWFVGAVPKPIVDKLHMLRVAGNKAAHAVALSPDFAVAALREAFDIGLFLFVSAKGKPEVLPSFRVPDPSDNPQLYTSQNEPDNSVGHSVLSEPLAPDLDDVPMFLLDQSEPSENLTESVRIKVVANLNPKRVLKKLAGKALSHTSKKEFDEPSNLDSETDPNNELSAVAETVANYESLSRPATGSPAHRSIAVDQLGYNEDETRKRLIDMELASAGWSLSDETQVGQEIEVCHQPTTSGKGFADYVLWGEDGKPLAVIEAKKTSRDESKGREQARIYADGLEKQYGQRPLIFYTNGWRIRLWDDAQGYPPRTVWGYYSRDSLVHLVKFQRAQRKQLAEVEINPQITDRLYQIEAIKAVCEKFTAKHQRALVVQATGTGKTRVAISLTDVLMRAGWAKRILFLCDRKELRKQAKNAFSEFLSEPVGVIGQSDVENKEPRIFLATYPGMMKSFRGYDIGYFDLIIADESHRSIYNRYLELFRYFDCFQVGLTATPVDFINRNTFKMFDSEEGHPTAYYPLEQAIEEKFLVPYEVWDVTTQFLREGIHYDQLNDEQRQQLEEDLDSPQEVHIEAREIDRQILNRGTARSILRNLMENGITEATGQHVGKTIVFARSHEHAELLKKEFDQQYPQYGGRFCSVIDTYMERADELIGDFKKKDGPITIAMSVDMLDTGIDVPEVVNLVFAKPVKSKVKFWQMIGRGTRLCLNLFGQGQDKTSFRIFDHWKNFEYFNENHGIAESTRSKGLMQLLFEARVALADLFFSKQQLEQYQTTIKQIAEDIRRLPRETIAVREKVQVLEACLASGALDNFTAELRQTLLQQVAPLMQWTNIRGQSNAYRFDLVMTKAQIAKTAETADFADHRDEAIRQISQLSIGINAVRERIDTINQAKDISFWSGSSPAMLEELRGNLRPIMQYRQESSFIAAPTPVVDVDDESLESNILQHLANPVQMKLWEERISRVLDQILDTNPVLQRIRRNEPVTETDLEELVSLVLTQNPDVDINVLREFYGEARPLEYILRLIVGMDATAVKERFQAFVQRFPSLDSRQTRFLRMLQNHISRFGSIDIPQLYAEPFTRIDAEGLDGVFDEGHIELLSEILSEFQDPGIGRQAPAH